jgi:hypothetical protein
MYLVCKAGNADMKIQQEVTESPHNSKPKNSADTCLNGRWLLMARVLWIALVAFPLSIFFVCLPILTAQLEKVCVGNECIAEQLTPDTLRVLHDLGLSASKYAIISLVLIVAEATVWFTVSGVLAWRKSNDWFVLLVALMLVLLSTNNVMNLIATSHSLWQIPAQLCHFLSLVLLFLVFSLFPNGRFVPRWMVWLLVIWVVFQSINIFFPDAPWGVNNWPFLLVALFWFPLLGSLVFAQIYRFVRVSNPIQQEQTKWVVFGVVVVIVGEFVIFIPPVIFPTLSGSLYGLASGQSFDILTLLIPLSFGFAMLRYHLWDIDVLINRTLVYGLLTAILALFYVGLIVILQFLLRDIINQNNDVAIVVSTLVIAALFQPLRRRIQQIIDRRFYRRKYDAASTLAAFSATLRNEVDLGQLSEHLVTVVQDTMQPSHVSLWLRQHDSKLPRTDSMPPTQLSQ